jgi:hypothetical protein
MNEQQHYQQFQQKTPNLFDSPEAIARHLLEVEQNDAGVVNQDSARSNLNPAELRTVRALGGLINEIEYAKKIMLSMAKDKTEQEDIIEHLDELKEYYKNETATTNVPSRSKGGFAMVLSKTDKQVAIQQIESMAEDVADQFDTDKKKPGLLGSFFKKKVPGV